MSSPTADKYSQDLWYLSDARSVWESLLHIKGQTGILSHDNHFFTPSEKCSHSWSFVCHARMNRYIRRAAKSHVTLAHVKSEVQSQLLLVGRGDSWHRLCGLDAVSSRSQRAFEKFTIKQTKLYFGCTEKKTDFLFYTSQKLCFKGDRSTNLKAFFSYMRLIVVL